MLVSNASKSGVLLLNKSKHKNALCFYTQKCIRIHTHMQVAPGTCNAKMFFSSLFGFGTLTDANWLRESSKSGCSFCEEVSLWILAASKRKWAKCGPRFSMLPIRQYTKTNYTRSGVSRSWMLGTKRETMATTIDCTKTSTPTTATVTNAATITIATNTTSQTSTRSNIISITISVIIIISTVTTVIKLLLREHS